MPQCLDQGIIGDDRRVGALFLYLLKKSFFSRPVRLALCQKAGDLDVFLEDHVQSGGLVVNVYAEEVTFLPVER